MDGDPYWDAPSPFRRLGHQTNNVWAVGNGGTIIKWNGTVWTTQTSVTASYLRGIWGTRPTTSGPWEAAERF